MGVIDSHGGLFLDRCLCAGGALVELRYRIYTTHSALLRGVGGARASFCPGGRNEVLGELQAGGLREVWTSLRGGSIRPVC